MKRFGNRPSNVSLATGCLLAASAVALLASGACGTSGGGSGTFSCVYEVSSTPCNSGAFGPYTAECATIDFELRDDLSPEQFCNDAYSGTDFECGGGCCVSFRFRNTHVESGACF